MEQSPKNLDYFFFDKVISYVIKSYITVFFLDYFDVWMLVRADA